MAYSNIVSVEVKNFMVYSKAKLVFDESNIVNIKGYNSSGKSTMLKAIGVCLMNMYPRSQTKLIRHGEDYFRIVVNFSDGVSIIRDKYANGQSLYEMYKDGSRLFTTMEGKRLGRVDDVPEIIKNYLGLCQTSYGYLNYQSRQDKLWLVETTGSENYATLNEILKSEELSRANALINSDKNKLSSEITSIEASLQSVRLERLSAEGYTEELLHALESREDSLKELHRKGIVINRIYDTIAELKSIKVSPEVPTVNTKKLSSIGSISDLTAELGNIKVYPEVTRVVPDRLQGISGIGSLSSQLVEMQGKVVMTSIPSVGYQRVESASNIVSCVKSYVDAYSTYSGILNDVKATKNELASRVAEAEKSGIHFVKCVSCGSYTEVKEGDDR